MNQYQICWDCKHATGSCNWSSYGEPVEGWTAKLLKPNGAKPYETYMISDCPEFVRDAWNGGTRKLKDEIKLR